MTMRCPNCGQRLADEAGRCPVCGTVIDEETRRKAMNEDDFASSSFGEYMSVNGRTGISRTERAY
ncbi:MAG: zinc-ribbon domain-containing protein [Coprococcus sp.]